MYQSKFHPSMMRTTKKNDFAVFILTHGRPSNVITINTLKKLGYTGLVYLVIDNEDKTAEEYYKNFGRDRVIMFDKKAYADSVDEGNNFDERRTITHARNACFDIARQIGVTYFMQLDDDYMAFRYRAKNGGEYLKSTPKIKSLDRVFMVLLEYFKSIPALSIAMSQGGDWIGGGKSTLVSFKMKRKAMNSFICSVDRPFKFVGAMNEDVNTYTTLGSRGALFFTIPFVDLQQKATQSQAGGITDMYLKYGTYVKSFTTIMMMPSSVTASMMGNKNMRLHHKIKWANTVPRILPESCKK
jgi:hypothetical protein